MLTFIQRIPDRPGVCKPLLKATSESLGFLGECKLQARFVEDFEDMAATAGISTISNNAELLRALRRWLSNAVNGKWLMIIDTAGSDDILFDLDVDLDRTLSSVTTTQCTRSRHCHLH